MKFLPYKIIVTIKIIIIFRLAARATIFFGPPVSSPRNDCESGVRANGEPAAISILTTTIKQRALLGKRCTLGEKRCVYH